jgi:hypothetical protein
MKYVKEARQFTTEEFSIQETIIEIKDVLWIVEAYLKEPVDARDLKSAHNLLETALDYLKYVSKKVDKTLKYVPSDIQEKENL